MITKVAAIRRMRRVPAVRLPTVMPGLIVLGAGLVLAPFDGGFALTVWYPAALFLLALLVSVVVAAPPARVERSRLTELALVAYGLFCAWTFLSLTWAGMPGQAWDGANRVLLYGVVLALVCLRPWSPRAALGGLALVAFGTTVIAIGLLTIAITGSDPAGLFVEGRLSAPVGYLNATANLWLIGFFPAVHLATARPLPWPVRGVGLAAATLLLQVALLSQSRGAAIAFAVTVVLFVALTPRRWPVLGAVAAAVALTVLAADPLLDVRDAAPAIELGAALERASGAIALSAGIAALLGAVAALGGLGSREWLSTRPAAGRAGNLALGAMALCTVVALLVAIGDPVAFADERWRDFKSSGYTLVDDGRSRFGGSLGSGRYDFYRVALAEFREHPVRGIGASNFGAEYLQQRRTAEAPANPHSLAFRILSQLGIIGAMLFGAFLALMLAATLRSRRLGSSDHGAVVVAALMGAGVWLVHSGGDWLWEFPALGMLALGMLGIAARARPSPVAVGAPGLESDPGRAKPTSGFLVVRLGVAVVVLAAAISLAVPGVAARYANAGYESVRTDPELALERLERAASLNRLTTEPLIAKGVIAQRLGELDVAADAFRRAVERSPESWFAHFELGLVTALQGDVRDAEPSLREAVRLNPGQPVVREALATIRRGEAVDPRVLEERLNAQLQEKLGATDPAEASDSDE